ncbi:MAG: DUF1850 domain-containing protein [Sedimentibacter sp.]
MKKRILFCFVALLISILFIPFFKQFTIINGKTNNIVFSRSIDSYKDFYISFIHSVNKTPVNEYYRIEHDKFIAYKTTFYSYGAGMPEISEIPGAQIKFNEYGLIEIDNINREFIEFTYMVGTYADHTLHTESESFKLEKYVEPQEPALFKISRVSIFDIFRRKFDE